MCKICEDKYDRGVRISAGSGSKMGESYSYHTRPESISIWHLYLENDRKEEEKHEKQREFLREKLTNKIGGMNYDE